MAAANPFGPEPTTTASDDGSDFMQVPFPWLFEETIAGKGARDRMLVYLGGR
jgi:hypothetical protein